MAAYLHAAPDEPASYNDAGRAAGKLVLEYLTRHPEDRYLPAEARHEWPNGLGEPAVEVAPGIYDNMKRSEPDLATRLDNLDLTGFLWGWGVNAAKYALELPPVANPAILTVVVPDEGAES
jgi:hypothetical protein